MRGHCRLLTAVVAQLKMPILSCSTIELKTISANSNKQQNKLTLIL